MKVSERSLLSQSVFAVRLCILVGLGIFLFADYVQAASETVTITFPRQNTSSAADSVMQPGSSYVSHQNGDVLLTYSPDQ